MVYVLLADGFEEVEALAPVDILRRAGVEVRLVGVTGRTVVGSHGVPMLTDCAPADVDMEQTEMLILPGGMPGTKNLYASAFVQQAVRDCMENNRYVAAICAAPSIVLGGMGLLKGKRATCYPGMENGMEGADPQDLPCCVDGNIITGRAAGAALDFALTLCCVLKGDEVAEQVRHEIHYVRR